MWEHHQGFWWEIDWHSLSINPKHGIVLEKSLMQNNYKIPDILNIRWLTYFARINLIKYKSHHSFSFIINPVSLYIVLNSILHCGSKRFDKDYTKRPDSYLVDRTYFLSVWRLQRIQRCLLKNNLESNKIFKQPFSLIFGGYSMDANPSYSVKILSIVT